LRFYLDEHIPARVAEIARGRCGLDVLCVEDVATFGWGDPEQLRFAAEAGRCLVTRDRDDFVEATLRAAENGDPHAGVLIVTRALPSNRPAAIAEALCAFARERPDGLAAYEIQFLAPA